MHEILTKISQIGIVPVIAISDAEKAVPLAKALIAGGIPCAEVTFRTADGEEAIRRISKDVPEILLGAGTVTSKEQVDRAIAAGAKFIVSPGLNPRVVAYCGEKGIPITPGCANPSDIEAAMELGLEVVKFFPAEQAGGLDYIKAIAAPYTKMKFMPTGGINAANINKYLAFEKIIACGGSWMVSADLINNGKFDEITRLCREAVRLTLGLEIARVDDASGVEELFSAAFGFEKGNGNAKKQIVLKTNSVLRAKAFFEGRGFEFEEGSGNTSPVYFKKLFGGFAACLIKK